MQALHREPISVTIYKDDKGWVIVGRADGKVYKTRSQSEKGAMAYASEWVSLWENGELY